MIAGRFAGAGALLDDYRAFAGRRFALALALMLGGAVAEGLGILALIPLLALAAGSGEMLETLRPIIGGSSVSETQRFVAALGLFLALMAVRSLLLYRRDRLLSDLSNGYGASLKLRSASSLAWRGWEKANQVGQAGLQSLLLVDIPRSVFAIHYVQQALVAAAMLSVQFVIAMFLSWSLALIGAGLILFGLALSWRWVARGQRSGVAISAVSERSGAAAIRLHAGLKAALAQGTVAAFLREYRFSLGELVRETVGFERDQSLARALASAGAALCAALLLVIGDRWLDLPFPLLLAILVLFARMTGPAQQLQQSVQAIAVHVPSFAVVRRHLSGGVDAPEPVEGEALDWGELSLDGASYRHPGSGGGVTAVDLKLKRGEWVGLSGPSGAGKTTVADMIAGLLPPQGGRIALDGWPLEGKVLERWRPALTYVGQTDTVFDDSVRGNLLAEGAEASEERMWQVLEAVGLDRRIAAFPEKLDAQVGDRGSGLSGGERQRLMLARALLRGASLMILDEATNALDSDSEMELLGRLRALEPRPAVLLIAHRSGPLTLCDIVVDIGAGGSGPDDA